MNLKKEISYLHSKIGKLNLKVTTLISPTLASKYLFKRNFRRKLNLKNPQTFNEKIMWLKLNTYYKNDIVTQCVDKYRVREYIKDKGYKEILNELIGVYDNANQIDWNKLPNKFVLKCNFRKWL